MFEILYYTSKSNHILFREEMRLYSPIFDALSSLRVLGKQGLLYGISRAILPFPGLSRKLHVPAPPPSCVMLQRGCGDEGSPRGMLSDSDCRSAPRGQFTSPPALALRWTDVTRVSIPDTSSRKHFYIPLHTRPSSAGWALSTPGCHPACARAICCPAYELQLVA